ncbi:MAG: alpha/beta fold hydrolase [Alphaproteobacteria bacterium]|jgi:3-oxoadipate enol-lactonase
MEIQTAYVPGTPRIAFDEVGSGSPLLFLHGIGGNRTNWHEQLLACAPQFRAMAWDARGYGQSDDYEGPLDFASFADDVIRLLDHLGIAKAHLVGLSMGGRISQDLYFRHPGRVATLTLCDSFPGTTPTLSPDKMEEFINLRKGPLMAGKSLREMAVPLAKTLLSVTPLPEHSRRLLASIEALHKDSYIKTIEASTCYDRPVDIATISVPMQLIYGAEDRLTPPEIGREMQRQIPGARLAIIEGAGHLVNMERGEAFNEVLLGFLRQHQGLADPPSMKAP